MMDLIDIMLVTTIIIVIIPILYFVIGYFKSIEFKCKFKRRFFKKNFGIVYFVSKDGKQIIASVKNFDHDTIATKDKIWILEPDKIYTETGEIKIPIKEEYIKFKSGIPILFLSVDSLYPLNFFKEESKINPAELFAPVNAYIITKEAELLRWKKTMTVGLIILLVLLAICVYYSFDTNNIIREKILPIIQKFNTTI